ncbi:hypothetical protein SKAU_G00322420 [Synaphobranchus kaupii]|uniref:Stromal interaction molecule 1 n=1 Tax=Synaphobranchus kaupii TaxID=118154 RepID=A0A9Q1IK11_SYNKA|nr:hypothetical protein SKAU_G00322420 [Synaphobranchus kaupii]
MGSQTEGRLGETVLNERCGEEGAVSEAQEADIDDPQEGTSASTVRPRRQRDRGRTKERGKVGRVQRPWGEMEQSNERGKDGKGGWMQALGEVTAALREKLHRWQQIELLTGFTVVNNPGLPSLASALNLDPSFMGGRSLPQHFIISDDMDDMDEDIMSPGTMQYAAWQMDRRVSDLWPMCSDSLSPWKQSAPSLMSLRQRHIDPQLSGGSQRDLNRSDSDSSLCLSQSGDQLRLSASFPSRGHGPVKPASLLHGHTPNGGTRLQEGVADSPLMMKKSYGIEKSASLGEINTGLAGLSQSESSRSLSPTSTEPDTPSPMGPGGVARGNGSRIPQLSSKKSPLEEDSGSTGEDTDSTASRKKHTFKIFKKQKK